MNLLETVSTVRLYRLIADQIAARIDAGEFKPGVRLPAERVLAERLGVSRASVREALIALELEGRVDVRVGSGIFVLDPRERVAAQNGAASARERRCVEVGPFDLLETRLLLEPEAAARAATQALPEQREDLERACAQLRQGTHHQEHDRDFHLAIARACGNAALGSAIAHVWDLCVNNRVFERMDEHYVSGLDWEQAALEHERVMAAVRRRDSVGARTAMQDHLASVLARLRRDFDQTLMVSQ